MVDSHLVRRTIVVVRHVAVPTDLQKKIVVRKIEIGAILPLVEKNQRLVYESDLLRVKEFRASFLVTGTHLSA